MNTETKLTTAQYLRNHHQILKISWTTGEVSVFINLIHNITFCKMHTNQAVTVVDSRVLEVVGCTSPNLVAHSDMFPYCLVCQNPTVSLVHSVK